MADDSLSVRAERALCKRPQYMSHLFDALADPWSEDNPDGYMMAAVAENTVSAQLLWERLESNKMCTPMPLEIMKYNDMKGIVEFRRVLAELLQRTTMHGIQVVPENVALGAGTCAVLDNLLFCVTDPGNTCLIPAPYYPLFDEDLNTRNAIKRWPVHLDEMSEDLSAQLSAARRAATVAGSSVRSLLLTNPDNPTGRLYTEAQMRSAIQWCCDNEVHCVVDEVFGWSVFGAAAPFRSAMVIATEWAEQQDFKKQEKLWRYVHVIVGFSKDFCMSGFRVAGLYSYNSKLMRAIEGLSAFSAVSNLTQWHLLCLLNDTEFVDAYLLHNQEQLAHNCAILVEGLDSMGVQYFKPQAGFFVWMSLKEQVGIATFEREREVLDLLFQTEKVYVVNGEACHAQSPGHFRVCFAAHSAEGIATLVERLRAFIARYKVTTARQNWDTQNFMLAGGFGN